MSSRARLASTLLLAGLAGLATVVTGCSAEAVVSAQACRTAADCTGAYTCEASRCVPPPAHGPERVHVEVTPPSASPYVRTQILALDIVDPTKAVDFELTTPATYQIEVLDADGAPLDAKLFVLGDHRIPGRELEATVDVRPSASRAPVVRLNEGSYSARVDRLDGRPSLDTAFVVRAPGGVDTKEFRFRPYRRIFGEVTSALTVDTKERGVRVIALSDRTGLPSTSTVTDAAGRYAVDLPDTDDTAFVLVATPPASIAPAWGYEELVLVPRGQDREKSVPLEPTGESVRGRARLRVGGVADGFQPAPLANVSLTATAASGLSTRTYRVQGTTDLDGYVVVSGASGTDVPVLKGTYVVEVDPARDGPFGHLSTTLDLTRAGPDYSPDVQVLLPLEELLVGSVRSDLGRPVPSATVELRASDAARPPILTTTDTSGTFVVRVEAGHYLLAVRPSSHSDVHENLPVAIRAVEVRAGTGAPVEVTVTLPRGVTVGGTVRSADGGVIPESRVEFFAEASGLVVSLGDTKTDTSGHFSLVLPETVWP